MAVRKMKALKALALFLVFCFAQVYVQAGLTDPGAGGVPQRLIAARVTSTRNNQPILINNNSAGAGTTILTGAIVETGDQASATIDISPLGSFDIGPNSRVQLDFNESGFRLKVFRGCVAVKSRGNDNAEVYTEEGASEKTNSKRRAFGVCFLNGQLTPQTATAAAGGGLSGAQWGAIIASIGGTTVLIIGANNGGTGRPPNPSP
jgi:hypothetical protein